MADSVRQPEQEQEQQEQESTGEPATNGVHHSGSDTDIAPEQSTDIVNGKEPAGDEPSAISKSVQSLPEASVVPETQNAPSTSSTARPIVKSSGPRLLDKVISHTRPPHLPPKQKQEDLKHMADWQGMMKQSRVADSDERRKKSVDERRFFRELAVEQQIPVWERDIVPDWKAVYRDPPLRKLWWNGIPAKLRGQLWASSIGNALALGKDSYRNCLSRANRALASGQFPSTTLASIEDDISSTLPSIKLFLPGIGPMYDDLKHLLLAWMISRSDEGYGFYVPGVARIGAMLLVNMSSNGQAFIALRNYLERGCQKALYGGEASKEDLEAYYRIFDTLLADYMPKIYFNFKQHQISPAYYLPQWLIPAFLDHLPFEACARVWDVLVLEGDSFLYRVAIAILGIIESRLFFPEREELLTVLRGEHKVALEIASRNGTDTSNGKYSIYGIDDENLWLRLEEVEGWWKDSTWTRLLQRELPDV